MPLKPGRAPVRGRGPPSSRWSCYYHYAFTRTLASFPRRYTGPGRASAAGPARRRTALRRGGGQGDPIPPMYIVYTFAQRKSVYATGCVPRPVGSLLFRSERLGEWSPERRLSHRPAGLVVCPQRGMARIAPPLTRQAGPALGPGGGVHSVAEAAKRTGACEARGRWPSGRLSGTSLTDPPDRWSALFVGWRELRHH